jgi:hypothetical protein
MPEGNIQFKIFKDTPNQVGEKKERAGEKKDTIEVICSGCGKHLGFKDGMGISGVSHSLCEECARTTLEKMRSDLRKAGIE